MASADWTTLPLSLDAASVKSGVTSGVTPPGGGGSFVYAFNSRVTGIDGVRALKYIGDINFNPIPPTFGGRITGAMKRLPSGGLTGFAPFLYFAEQANDATTGECYMLGLQDDDPSAIVLRKGIIAEGLPSGLVGESGILRKSSTSIAADTWVHLRMDVIAQGVGDTVITVQRSESGDVTAPVWAAIPGMEDFVDDNTEINTGTPPLSGGRNGFGMYANDVGRRVAFDQLTIARQL